MSPRGQYDASVFTGQQLPSLWDPQEFFFHLAVWAGVPALVMAVAAALLGIIKSIQAWIGFGRSAVRGARVAGDKVGAWTTRQQRAMVRLVIFSVLAVAFSYMLAVIIDALARIIAAAPPNTIPTVKEVVDRVSVTPWPRAAVWAVVIGVLGITVLGIASIADLVSVRKFITTLGGVVWIAVWIFGGGLAIAAIFMCLGLLLQLGDSNPSNPVPLPLLVTAAVTGLVSLALVQLLPRVRAASTDAFAPSRRPNW